MKINSKVKKALGVAVISSSIALTACSNETNNSETNISTDTQRTTGEKFEYKDGTYSASGDYRSPAGNESVDVTITLSNNQVESLAVEGIAENSTSKQYQERFINGISDEVVGKNIDEIDLTRVNGSSLTPIGFENALVEIKAQAKE